MHTALSCVPFAACTIVPSNGLPRALVMADSLKRQHAGVQIWLLLVDDIPLGPLAGEAVDRRGIHLLRVPEIQLPESEIANMRFAYDLVEFSAACKPWLMETVTRLSGCHVFYLAPDLEFHQPLTSLVEAVEVHDLVLTPHVLHPMKTDGCQPSEADIMGRGIYNLGFLGMNRRAAAKVTAWWSERLLRDCYIAPAEQKFLDQRCMDLAPGFFDCHICRDDTCNVAHWNLDQRAVVLENGHYLVNGRPMSFFHFSGLDENTPHLLSPQRQGRPRVLLSGHPTLIGLVRSYINAVRLATAECADTTAEYPFLRFPGGEPISTVLRRIFLKELVKAGLEGTTLPPSPFAPGGAGAFHAWMLEPCPAKLGGTPLPRLALLLRESRRDLVLAFQDPHGRDASRMIEWVRNVGARHFMLPGQLIPGSLTPPGRRAGVRLVPGLEIIGYLRTVSGLGQNARLIAQALGGSSIRFETLVDSSPRQPAQGVQDHQPHSATLEPDEAFDCCLICANADFVGSVRQRLGPDYFKKRHVIGFWAWELEVFPKPLHAGFQEVDEIWVPSEFIRKVLAPISPVPVHCIPLPYGVPEPVGTLDRKSLGIPEGFFFLFSFDFLSIARRKNPLGLVDAFKLAFHEGEGPALVFKCINGDTDIAELERLRYAVRDRADIHILSGYLDSPTNQALTAACDCYVSLHRAEGFGLTMADAMRQQKPVIATAYSGNMDFMTEANSYLCRYDMVPVGPGASTFSADARWAEPSITHAAELMRHVHAHPEEAAEKGRRAARDLAAQYSPEHCVMAVEARLRDLRRLPANDQMVASV